MEKLVKMNKLSDKYKNIFKQSTKKSLQKLYNQIYGEDFEPREIAKVLYKEETKLETDE